MTRSLHSILKLVPSKIDNSGADAQKFYEKFVSMFKQDQTCPLCKRGFDSPEHSHKFEEKVSTLIHHSDSSLEG